MEILISNVVKKSSANVFIVVFIIFIVIIIVKMIERSMDDNGCMTSAHTQHQYTCAQPYGRILKKYFI